MTATVDETTHNNRLLEQDQVIVVDPSTPLDNDEDFTLRPNDFHQERRTRTRSAPDEPATLPVLHVSPPASPGVPSDGEARPSSPQSSYTHTEVTAAGTDRINRRRSIMDPRSSRFSGFITNLIGRRDRDRDQEHSPQPQQGRASSPSITPKNTLLRNLASMPRPITPPPPLPAPSLQDLGLSLSVLTSNLSPSHFTTPPTSGTFLSPHFLLLCHSQGLDVLPLTRPPSPQPYALVRRVPFKSVVIMEERGVLVAIAGRRDGVRVYALEEVRKVIEWRMDVEMRRELDRIRREDAKRGPSGSVDNIFGPASASASAASRSKAGLPLPSSPTRKTTLPISTPATSQSIPEAPAVPHRKTPPRPPSPPPSYEDPSSNPRPRLRPSTSIISINQSISHRTSISTVVGMPTGLRRRGSTAPDSKSRRAEEKGDGSGGWAGSSDDEAISLVAAGPSGSAALDERTSSTASASRRQPAIIQNDSNSPVIPTTTSNPPAINRSHRPSNLDLSGSSMAHAPNNAPSPTPTLTTLRQTLSRSPPLAARGPTVIDTEQASEGEGDGEGDGETATTPTGERISFAQALLESRLPSLPPPGTRRPQLPVLITASHSIVSGDEDIVLVSAEDARPPPTTRTKQRASTAPKPKTPPSKVEKSKRRRWTVLDGMFSNNVTSPSETPLESIPDQEFVSPNQTTNPVSSGSSVQPSVQPSSSSSITRSQSVRSGPTSPPSVERPRRTSEDGSALLSTLPPPQSDQARNGAPPRPSTSSNRFLPRIISNALSSRRSEEGGFNLGRGWEVDGVGRRTAANSLYTQSAAPKLEYVKLPGTKGSVMIKAVETAKKSFLAILCGEGGEKVELFAGTYRTALGLSRTFILPDSPRSLELQLQGDDLVEVFLVFSHNVFGLEPATVRVREVRIGRAERRAARRRAREARAGEAEQVDSDVAPLGEEDHHVSVNIGIGIPPSPDITPGNGAETPTSAPPNPARRVTDSGDVPSSPAELAVPTSSVTNPDDLVALAASQIGAYTTFQQLTFAPKFPLATLADECIIPPTYPSVLKCRPGSHSNADALNGDPSGAALPPPPGLPPPQSQPPSKWYYRDPKGIVQGPWKASLMQTWYKDGFLPLDLPVRRDTETKYTLLKDLRLQSVDPNHPFRPAPLPLSQAQPSDHIPNTSGPATKPREPLLHPISLLAHPKHYGPPALFFSSRGGHSTAIVDARGRSVLKGRFFWSIDDEQDAPSLVTAKLGDIKRVEAFDVRDRAVIVVLRQGGLEAIDVGDALLAPADESRTFFPDFQVPVESVSRRGTYVWRIGAPVSMPPVSSTRDALGLPPVLVRKKYSSAKSETPSSLGFDDAENAIQDEVLFLGRNDDSVYFCERNAASFRILRLAPSF